ASRLYAPSPPPVPPSESLPSPAKQPTCPPPPAVSSRTPAALQQRSSASPPSSLPAAGRTSDNTPALLHRTSAHSPGAAPSHATAAKTRCSCPPRQTRKGQLNTACCSPGSHAAASPPSARPSCPTYR